MYTNTLIGAALVAAAAATADLEFTSQGHFKIKHPAFVNVSKFDGGDDFLLVSQFSGMPMSPGHIYVVDDITAAVTNGDVSGLQIHKLDTPNFEWPNDVSVVPSDVFAKGENVIVVPDGFLVPGKSDGGIYLITMDPTDVTKTVETKMITATKKGFFYHMGYWVDLNGDGRKDFITARSNAKAGEGELLWLEHPEEGLSATEPWTEHVLGNVADVSIEVVDYPAYRNEVVVFAAEFFNEKISMHRISTVDGTLVQSKVIDDTNILSAYNVAMVDLNNTGNYQLLVNNHEKKDDQDGIWAYEFPKDPMNDDWTRATIATGFHNAFSITVPNMAPGFAYAVWPHGKTRGERAHIMVAGDGDHSAHTLYPSGDASTFDYEDSIFDDAKGTVGCLAFSDLDNDGWQEVWVPNYDKGTIELYKMGDAATPAEFLQ